MKPPGLTTGSCEPAKPRDRLYWRGPVADGVLEECYFQCAKALIRSKLWDNVTKGPACDFDFAKVLVDQTQIEGQRVESLKEQIEIAYKERLY